MNIVKGVADLIRRTSGGGYGSESGSGSPLERFSPPTPTIRFRYLIYAFGFVAALSYLIRMKSKIVCTSRLVYIVN